MVIADPNSIFNITRCNFLMKSNLTENSFDLNNFQSACNSSLFIRNRYF